MSPTYIGRVHMRIIYDENEGTPHGRGGAGHVVPYHKLNATANYVKHFSNLLYLHFILHNRLATTRERMQASRELVICQRKLQFWMRHPNWNRQAVFEQVEKLKRDWEITASAAERIKQLTGV